MLQATDTVLPLQNSFFNIGVTWETLEGVSGTGRAVVRRQWRSHAQAELLAALAGFPE